MEQNRRNWGSGDGYRRIPRGMNGRREIEGELRAELTIESQKIDGRIDVPDTCPAMGRTVYSVLVGRYN